MTPFHAGEAPEQLFLHRFRATWSAEGRHERLPLESLNLERSWIGFSARTQRFGQIGSLPVRQFFPWAALEDAAAGALWGVQLSAPASWHLEVARRKDRVTLSGGLPSRDFGEWWLTVAPGAMFATPPAALACVTGDVDDLCQALTQAQGLKATTDAIREQGLISGLWFELEAATEGTDAFSLTERLLRRDGQTVQVGSRRFWNFRDPQTVELLAQKVISRLHDDGFGYLKIDYNDTLPSGVDGAESPGEGLRQQIAAVQDFIQRIRRELPEIAIENCSSGGHRLEPSFQSICAVGSFSDAHETVAIPIIAANLHRVILPRQSQVWCVVHARDSLQRLRYGLAATFLGRMALSGDFKDLAPWQLAEIGSAQEFLIDCASTIRDGRSRLHRHIGLSWNEPRGWQALVRNTPGEALIVAHTFGGAPSGVHSIPIPAGAWRLAASYGLADAPVVEPGRLVLPPMPDFSGAAVRLARA